MAFLHQTQSFFIGQRVVWGIVIICLGMNPTTGSAVFTLITNLGATALATVAAFINWYIVGRQTAGIIVVLFLFLMIYFYFLVRYPRFLVAIASGAITHVLIVGMYDTVLPKKKKNLRMKLTEAEAMNCKSVWKVRRQQLGRAKYFMRYTC